MVMSKHCRKILRSKWTTAFLILMSITGFTWQVVVVSVEYFAYKTTTAVTFSLPLHVKPQMSALCFRYRDIMDRKQISDDQHKDPNARDRRKGEQLTIEQIFKYTPDVNQVIDRCLVREVEGTIRDEIEGCGEYFAIKKFFKQEEMCYHFERRHQLDILIEEVRHSTIKSSLVYEIQLTSRFNNATVVEGIVFEGSGGSYPFSSRDYAVKHWIKNGNKDKSTEERYISLSGSDIDIRRMPRPYDTQCLPRSPGVGFGCLLKCKLDLYKDIDRVPTSELLFQPLKRKPVSEDDKRDPSIRQKVQEMEGFCREKCSVYANWCTDHISITYGDVFSHPSDRIIFSVNIAKQPDLASRSVPVTTFIEYFSFIGGCFGIWFGVSFLSLRPTKLRKLVKFRNRVTLYWERMVGG